MKIFKNPTFVTLPYTTSCYWTAFVMFVGIFFMEKKCGIYKITSPSNKIYIGQSVDIKKRWNHHKYAKDKKCSKLYSSFKKYGINNHKFEIIHICLISELNNLEKYYVDLYGCFNSKNGLNLKDGGGSKGNVSEETKIKMSLAKIGKKKSNETKQKMSLYSKNRSENHLNNLSKSLTGKVHSNETKIKMSLSSIGQKTWNKGKSKYNFNIPYILKKLEYMSCISISKIYGCNEAVLRNFIKNNTGHSISYWKSIKEKKERVKLPF